jgi:hypothetical protein
MLRQLEDIALLLIPGLTQYALMRVIAPELYYITKVYDNPCKRVIEKVREHSPTGFICQVRFMAPWI